MSVSASRVPRFLVPFAAHAWWIILLAALTLHGLATVRRIARVEALTGSPTWSVDGPQRDATSPTGFERGQRTLIVSGHHNPSFWWIMEAQKSAGMGSLRLRHIDHDTPPDGRDIQRTAPYRWWLIVCGWMRAVVHDEPLGYAIERGVLIADPLLLGLLLVVGAAYCARFLGSLPAAGFALGGVSLFPLVANFQPGAPDPHSLAWVFALGSVFPLLVSSHRDMAAARRRVHFAAAGIFGGLGFWNDAPSQMAVLLATVLGAVGWELVRSRGLVQRSAAGVFAWRAWAVAGALTTLGASIFEFAPDQFSWSLESVNLVHAVVWLGFGEIVRATAVWSREGRRGFDRRSLVVLGLAVVAIGSWLMVGLMRGSGLVLAPDFHALELANHSSGGIASSLGSWLRRVGGAGGKWATLLPPFVLLFVLLAWIIYGRMDAGQRGRLIFAFVVMVFTVVLAFQQIRWWNLIDVFVLVAITVLIAQVEKGSVRTQLAFLGVTLAVVLPGLFVGFPPSIDRNSVDDVSPQEAQVLIARDFSYWLAKRGHDEPAVVFSTPVFSDAAAFYGGLKVTASSDHDNRTGYLASVRITSAATEQEASVLLNSRGITHVALPLWDPTLEQLVRVGRNLSPGQALPDDAFLAALQRWEVPLWMRPLDYLIPREPRFEEFELRVFAVVPVQGIELGLSRLCDFFVERGQLPEARSLRKALESYPRNPIALGAIANVDLAAREGPQLKQSLDALIPYLSRRSARNLPVDRRLSIATVLSQTSHEDLARQQLSACFEDLDPETLRTLSSGGIVNLLILSRVLGVPFPDKGLEEEALGLTPTGVRAELSDG